MAVILGKKIGFESLTGIDASTPPGDWECLAYKVDPGVWEWNWTAPSANWYTFHIVGDGGSGGNGQQPTAEEKHDGDWNTGSGGGGGSHGAYAVHTVFLKKGTAVQFVKSGTAISAAIMDAAITVEHGKAGGAGQNISGGAGGKAASASGANTANVSGLAGSKGELGHSGHGNTSDNTGPYYGGKGGSLSQGVKYSTGAANSKSPAPAADPAQANLGNAGSGGSGGSISVSSSGTPHVSSSAKSGYPGIPGGVVIDAGKAG